MKKRTVIRMILTLLLVIYLVVALSMSRSSWRSRPFTAVQVNVIDSLNGKFVTVDDIRAELDSLHLGLDTVARGRIDTQLLEDRIGALDKVEWVNCLVLNDGTLRIDVVPMIPIARIFDNDGSTYYINRQGKRFTPTLRYRADVPVVVGSFESDADVDRLIPMLEYIKNTPEMDALVSSINVDSRSGDIYLIPGMAHHVVNFGDTADIDNKWRRLRAFYRQVMPVRGWDFYDTISVKWRNQVVGNRRAKRPPAPDLQAIMRSDTIRNVDDPGEYQFAPHE